MKLVLQRVANASVRVDGNEIARIGKGLLVLFGAEKGDAISRADFLAEKTVNLRIFPDDEGMMNRSVLDIGGAVLAISQFTLFGDARKGRRPAFVGALEPAAAEALYSRYLDGLRAAGVASVEAGVFGAQMAVELVNDGPVTILLDTARRF